MGRRGPAPTPTKILESRGSWRARKRKGEPKAPAGTPPPPARLTPAQKTAWVETLKLVAALQIASPVDVILYERFVVALVLYRACTVRIDKEGLTLTDGDGDEFPHPLLKVQDAQGAIVDRLGDRMGLSPSARAGLKVGERKADAQDDPRYFND